MRSRNPQGLQRLSVAAIKYINEPGWHSDGGGLYLEVDASGRKRWAMRVTVNGKRRDFGLGPLHKVSLLAARERAAEYRAKAYCGIDPIAEKRSTKDRPRTNTPTFEQVARQVHAHRRDEWNNGKHVDQWINTLRDHVFQHIGAKPINEIGTPDVLTVLTPIWTAKPETARRSSNAWQSYSTGRALQVIAPATIRSNSLVKHCRSGDKSSSITPRFRTRRSRNSLPGCVLATASQSRSLPSSS